MKSVLLLSHDPEVFKGLVAAARHIACDGGTFDVSDVERVWCKDHSGRLILVYGAEGPLEDSYYGVEELPQIMTLNIRGIHHFTLECRWADLIVDYIQFAAAQIEGELWMVDGWDSVFNAVDLDPRTLRLE